MLEKFRAAREKTPDPLTTLMAADWLYRTGRAGDGARLLRRAVESTGDAALRANGYAQLAVWDLLAGNRAMAAADAMASGPVSSASLLTIRFVTMPSASAAEWEERAERILANPNLAALRPLALGYALLLDGKREAALQVWDKIAGQTHATDFFIHALDTRLHGKPIEHPLIPDPKAFNPFAALPDRLSQPAIFDHHEGDVIRLIGAGGKFQNSGLNGGMEIEAAHRAGMADSFQ